MRVPSLCGDRRSPRPLTRAPSADDELGEAVPMLVAEDDVDDRGVVPLFLGDDAAEPMNGGDDVAAAVGDFEVDGGPVAVGRLIEEGEECLHPLAGCRRDGDRLGVEVGEPLGGARGGNVHLVEDEELGDRGGADLGEDLTDGGDLTEGIGIRGVDDVEEEVGLAHVVEGRAEGVDEMVRQPPHEPDGVRDEDDPSRREDGAANGGVESREEPILGEDLGGGEPVEEGRLPRVRVPDEGHPGETGTGAGLALGGAGPGEGGELSLELGNAGEDPATVRLELGLAGSAGADAGTETGHLSASPAEARKVIAEEGQLDLEGAFPARGVLGEDVEDESLAVDDVAFEDLLEVPLLSRAQVVVDDDDVDVEGGGRMGELGGFSRADEGRRVDLEAADELAAHRIGAGGVGEEGELGERSLGGVNRHPGHLDPEKVGALADDAEVGDGGGEPSTLTAGGLDPSTARIGSDVGHVGEIGKAQVIDSGSIVPLGPRCASPRCPSGGPRPGRAVALIGARRGIRSQKDVTKKETNPMRMTAVTPMTRVQAPSLAPALARALVMVQSMGGTRPAYPAPGRGRTEPGRSGSSRN